jgi:hypothetical protein
MAQIAPIFEVAAQALVRCAVIEQRNVYRKTCGKIWALRDKLDMNSS